MENHYLLLQVRPAGKPVGLQNVPKNLVHRMQQLRIELLVADRIWMAYMEREPDGVSTGATWWPRRLPTFPTSPAESLGYSHYRLLGHSVLDALIDQNTNPTNQLKWKLDVVLRSRTNIDECVSPCALTSSLSPVELLVANSVVQQICENEWQNRYSIKFGAQMDVFCVMPLPPLDIFGTKSQQGSPKRRPLDTETVGSSPGTDQGDTPKSGREKKGEKKPNRI